MTDTPTTAIGKRVPALAGITADGSTLRLSGLRGKHVVIYFYPKDATPGCTLEAQDFRDLYPKFKALGCEIVGVSRDSAASHAKFCAKQSLPFPLVADVDETWCKTFDVIREKVLYGKRHMGIVRSTFLVDTAGVLRAEWRGVKVPGHAAEVLEWLARK
ncbi:MAG TPA: peroxiredoxin [Dokdonella sp.]|uniref:peroxiredoxin n=1 Tax=Dokdonella sp. TaxID=2291710 RepID=UPI0025C5B1D5|nr:peroxiredoxin [Dokdonella sp.]MBX3692485.1 peroxiredoxin [Dokdonella sp.]HNR92572.1 peroxiredoxin [Dokdonella sp.]